MLWDLPVLLDALGCCLTIRRLVLSTTAPCHGHVLLKGIRLLLRVNSLVIPYEGAAAAESHQ